MMRATLLLALFVTGCLIKPDPPGTVGPGGIVPGCATYSEWSAPTIIASSKSTDYIETDAALSPDGEFLVFTREPSTGGASTLWMMTVDGTTFGTPVDLGLGPNVVAATWTPTGKELYAIASDVHVTMSFDSGALGTMQPTSEFDSLNAQRPEGRFTVAGDGTDIYYEISVSNVTRLFHASGTLGGSWVSTGELTELDALGTHQATPQISFDGTELLFSTANGGSAQLASARRGSTTEVFSDVGLIPLQVDGERPTISRDGKLLVYNSADFDLFYATRTCK